MLLPLFWSQEQNDLKKLVKTSTFFELYKKDNTQDPFSKTCIFYASFVSSQQMQSSGVHTMHI